jgi:hypothetical protein
MKTTRLRQWQNEHDGERDLKKRDPSSTIHVIGVVQATTTTTVSSTDQLAGYCLHCRQARPAHDRRATRGQGTAGLRVTTRRSAAPTWSPRRCSAAASACPTRTDFTDAAARDPAARPGRPGALRRGRALQRVVPARLPRRPARDHPQRARNSRPASRSTAAAPATPCPTRSWRGSPRRGSAEVETVTAPGPRRSGGSPAASAPRGPAPGARGPRPRPRTGGFRSRTARVRARS